MIYIRGSILTRDLLGPPLICTGLDGQAYTFVNLLLGIWHKLSITMILHASLIALIRMNK